MEHSHLPIIRDFTFHKGNKFIASSETFQLLYSQLQNWVFFVTAPPATDSFDDPTHTPHEASCWLSACEGQTSLSRGQPTDQWCDILKIKGRVIGRVTSNCKRVDSWKFMNMHIIIRNAAISSEHLTIPPRLVDATIETWLFTHPFSLTQIFTTSLPERRHSEPVVEICYYQTNSLTKKQ